MTMDPNETLRIMLARARAIIKAEAHGHVQDPEDALDLAEAVGALDGWIRRGGFLPSAWEAGRHGQG